MAYENLYRSVSGSTLGQQLSQLPILTKLRQVHRYRLQEPAVPNQRGRLEPRNQLDLQKEIHSDGHCRCEGTQ